MLPVSDHSSPDPLKRSAITTAHKTSSDALLERKTSFNSLNSSSPPLSPPHFFSLHHHHHHHCRRSTWLLLIVLVLQIALLCMARSIPLSFPLLHDRRRHFPSPTTTAASVSSSSSAAAAESATLSNTTASATVADSDQCSLGRVYVYEMPSFFNKELLEQCDNLNPWSSRCDAMVNEGFGPPATRLTGLIPDQLIPAWFWTDQFVSEIIFHSRIMKHECRTMEPGSATAYYIPFYAGLAVGKYLWKSYTALDRDRYCQVMLDWVQDQEFYKKSGGWDHFITMGRITWDFRRSKAEDWGSGCIYMAGMRNITRLLIERNPWDYFDVGIPYPTGFHPRSGSDIARWQDYIRTRPRGTLFCFAGAPRSTIKNDFRGFLLNQCRAEGSLCRAVNCSGSRCSNGTSAILETFLDSRFCLQPRGDSFTRRSIFDCMVAGSIPVFFWKRTAYYQYEWFLPGEPKSYSVYIDRNEVKNGTSIRRVLESYSEDEVSKMRERVIEYIPKIVYSAPQEGLEVIKDAFDVAIDGVLRRFKEQESWGYKWR